MDDKEGMLYLLELMETRQKQAEHSMGGSIEKLAEMRSLLEHMVIRQRSAEINVNAVKEFLSDNDVSFLKEEISFLREDNAYIRKELAKLEIGQSQLLRAISDNQVLLEKYERAYQKIIKCLEKVADKHTMKYYDLTVPSEENEV
ncbi:MAG: hypothetical protein FWG43_06350 [Clostridiales bacterium]|nr:hypothetical protein [Clostridiales bacterium]